MSTDSTPNKPIVSQTQTPTTLGKQMSCGLKERLKRCGRYHASPISTKKSRNDDNSMVKSDHCNSTSMIIEENNHVDSERKFDEKCDKNEHTNIDYDESSRIKYASSEDTQSSVKGRGVKRTILGQSKPAIGVIIDENAVENPEHHNSNIDDEGIYQEMIDDKHEKLENECDVSSDSITTTTTPGGDVVISDENLSGKDDYNSEGFTVGSFNDRCSPCSDVVRGGNELTEIKTAIWTGNETTGLDDYKKKREIMLDVIRDKKETLRKLSLVKMYREKNNLEEVTRLINKWRTTCQSALEELHTRLQQPDSTINDVINHLNLDIKLIQYDLDDESFY